MPSEIEEYLSPQKLAWMRPHVVGWLIEPVDTRRRAPKPNGEPRLTDWEERAPGAIKYAHLQARKGLVILTQHRMRADPKQERWTLLLAVVRKRPGPEVLNW